MRLMMLFCWPSFSITKVRKKPSGGVRLSALRARLARNSGLWLAFCATSSLRFSTSAASP
ncbi:hypothetical protein D3C73_1657530 [compost metagenome]